MLSSEAARKYSTRLALVFMIASTVLVTAYKIFADELNVTTQVNITKSGLVLNRSTNTFDMTVTLTNNSANNLGAPGKLVIQNISNSAVTLANAAGTTSSGDPYVLLPISAAGLSPGGQLSNVVLKFANKARVAFTFSQAILAQVSANVTLSPVQSIQASPFSIVGGQPTLVSITATLSKDLPFTKSSVTLWRYDDTGKPVANLGQMFDDGTQGDAMSGDNIFTKQITLNEVGPGFVILRVTANTPQLQTVTSPNLLIPISVSDDPENARQSFAQNIRSGNLSAAYATLGNLYNTERILDNLPINVLINLADVVSSCTVVEKTDSFEICAGSMLLDGQVQELRFFLVPDVFQIWRIIRW